MIEQKAKRNYFIFIALFIILNILSTFIVTTETLNRYIISFDYTFIGIVNSMIGNAFFLFLIMYLLFIVIRNPKHRLISLLVVTFLLNGSLFAINIFNRYYGTSFTVNALAIFKNPGDGFGLTLFWEALRELVTYYRVILFIPLFVLLGYYIVIRGKGLKELEVKPLNLNRFITKFTFVVLLFFVNITVFSAQAKTMNIINSSKATYATQNLGIYNYLLLDTMGYDYQTDSFDYEKIQDELDKYNKNQDSYENFLDGNTYSKSPLISDVNSISGALIDGRSNDESLTGILKDYNLVLVHLESINQFLLSTPETSKHFYNLKGLLNQSYVFENFYSNVGLGNSFDAELAVLTGLMPNGTSTIAWDYNEKVENKHFDFQALPKLFNNTNKYETNSIHGNREDFYNRNIIHPDLFGFDKFKGKETIIKDYGMTFEEIKEIYKHESNQWLSDRATLDYLNQDIKDFYSKDQQFMQFLITMMPHTPYFYNPYHLTDNDNRTSDLYSTDLLDSLDIVAVRYLNFVKYYNEFFRIMFEDFTDYGTTNYDSIKLYYHKKTAFVFYGDHGSGLKQKDLSLIMNKELDALETRNQLSKTTAFIYVPGENVVTEEIDGVSVSFKEGLLKGSQHQVRSQLDLHRTIIDLFDLPITKEDYLFGVHGMSTEPTYSLDNKSLDFVTDAYMSTIKNSRLILPFGDQTIDLNQIDLMKEYIINFKKYSDLAMDENLYRQFKKKTTR